MPSYDDPSNSYRRGARRSEGSRADRAAGRPGSGMPTGLSRSSSRGARSGNGKRADGRMRTPLEGRRRPDQESRVRSYDPSIGQSSRARSQTQSAQSRRVPASSRMPLTSEESRHQVERSRDKYERARADRRADASFAGKHGRQREVIDGRGSIDSRAFNERNELVGYTINRADRHAPMLDVPADRSKWGSNPGRGRNGIADTAKGMRSRNQDLRRLSDTISGRSDFQGNSGTPAVPTSIKVLGALIVVLLLVLIFILIF